MGLATVLKNVPIYTGAAKGTFEPLTRVLRRFDVSNPYTSPINARAKRKVETGTIIQGTKYDLGYYGAQKYGQTFFEIPKSVILSSGITFTFAFSNDLPYMLWNDIYPAPVWMNMPSNPPWDYINKGIEAFKNYVDLELPKYIPGIEPYISVQVVSVR